MAETKTTLSCSTQTSCALSNHRHTMQMRVRMSKCCAIFILPTWPNLNSVSPLLLVPSCGHLPLHIDHDAVSRLPQSNAMMTHLPFCIFLWMEVCFWIFFPVFLHFNTHVHTHTHNKCICVCTTARYKWNSDSFRHLWAVVWTFDH